MRLARLLVALCFAFCAAAAAAAETAGQVMFASGETLALRDGRIHQLNTGAPVESGDQIHTGTDSYLQIRFTDWSVMSLRPRTDFVIDEYAYEPRLGGRERAFFSLLGGGIRSLTGMIGHHERANYRLRTKIGTIGIRGTHYSVLICKQDCRDADGSLGADGLYGGVTEGRIAVSPFGGAKLEREFAAGEYFRLDSANSIPVPVFTPPPFFWDKLARSNSKTFAGIPWKPAPGVPGPSDPAAGGDPVATAGPLVRTDGSLTLSPITAPVLNLVGGAAGSTVGGVAAPITSLVGSTVSTLTAPIAPVTTALGSTVGGAVGSLVNPVAPIAPVLGSTVGGVVSPVVAPVASIVGSTVTPVIAPVASVVGSTVTPVLNPVVAPVIAPVISPIVAPVAPVIAPIMPVIAPPTTTVSLPTVPSLPALGGLPSLFPKK